MTDVLREVLRIGIANAVAAVAGEDGFLAHAHIAIPLPAELEDMGRVLRGLGFGAQVDEFVKALNRAAGRAAPKAAVVLADAALNMTIEDALSILRGPDDSITAHFRRRTRDELYPVFLPVVRAALEEAGVTELYRGLLALFNSPVSFDLDAFMTAMVLDGFFVLLAGEERKIRRDPSARVTELLKKAFGRRHE